LELSVFIALVSTCAGFVNLAYCVATARDCVATARDCWYTV